VSDLDVRPEITVCGGRSHVTNRPVLEVFAGREVNLGGATMVRRLLPNQGRRLVGAWCFVDHYGPDDIADGPGMTVPPHPHIGLQTVSWLLDGEVHHQDSLGSDALIRPGQLGLMTAGAGITHAEYSPVAHPRMLHGVQLWVALPEASRHTRPRWEHHPHLPTLTDDTMAATVILGAFGGSTVAGRTYSPIVGVDVSLDAGARTVLPLEPDFEYAVLAMSGAVTVEQVEVRPGALVYLGCGRRELALTGERATRCLLLGGEPFDEQIVMWWNFVARTNEEIVAARNAWIDGESLGTVGGLPRTPAPPLPAGRLKPGGSTRR
jgi:quercetin 2,3-dioxygenase